jgi:hypothetical protein
LWWKDAEILMLRHQLAVAERERPHTHSRLTWPDRAWLALLAGTVSAERLAAMRLVVAPGTIVRWQRDIVRRRWVYLSRRIHGDLAGLALDFFTADLLNGAKVYVLTVMEHGTRGRAAPWSPARIPGRWRSARE